MKYAYWLINNEICARAGPNEQPWQPQELFGGGIRAVLSVNTGDGVVAGDLTRLGMSYRRVTLPITTPPSTQDFKQCLRKLSRAYDYVLQETQKDRPVLVHCRHGNDRSGLFLAYYLARRYEMSADQAIAELRSRRARCLTAYGWQRFTRDLINQAMPTPVSPS